MAKLPQMRGAERPHVSASFIVDYFNCAYLAKRKRVDDSEPGEERIPFIKYARQAVGTAAHAAIEDALRTKAAGKGEAVTVEYLRSIFAARFGEEMQNARIDAHELEQFGTDARARGKLKDQGITIVDFFHAEVLPHRDPIAAEVEVRIPLSGSFDLYGIIDEVDHVEDGIGIRDQKIIGHGRGKDPDADLRQQVSLTLYAAGAAVKFNGGVLPSSIVVDNYTRGETNPDLILSSNRAVERKPHHIDRLVALADECARGWEADYFPPTGLGKWVCDAKWCPIYPCKFVLGVE